MFDKKTCSKCRFHGYLGTKSRYSSDAAADKITICDYAKHMNRTCLQRAGKTVIDRRGDDPEHCKLFEVEVSQDTQT